MLAYLMDHVNERYFPESRVLPGLQIFTNRFGWKDCYLGHHLIFSHRTTTYDMSIFPEKLHTHPFFELDIYVSGNITYIADNHEIQPTKGDIILFPPGVLHTARQSEKSQYERYVFYFEPVAFELFSAKNLPALFQEDNASCLSVDSQWRGEFQYLLEKLFYTVGLDEHETALTAFSYILQLFVLIGRHTVVDQGSFMKLPQNVLQVKLYIDENYHDISTTAEVADHFFYSREYVSRIFKQYFNINISEYLVCKKLDLAKRVLEEGKNVTQAFSASGYRSMSSFVTTFRNYTGMTPSEYRRQNCLRNARS